MIYLPIIAACLYSAKCWLLDAGEMVVELDISCKLAVFPGNSA